MSQLHAEPFWEKLEAFLDQYEADHLEPSSQPWLFAMYYFNVVRKEAERILEEEGWV